LVFDWEIAHRLPDIAEWILNEIVLLKMKQYRSCSLLQLGSEQGARGMCIIARCHAMFEFIAVKQQCLHCNIIGCVWLERVYPIARHKVLDL
jgi:hypothetical protein